MKVILKTITVYISGFLAATLFYILLFRTPLFGFLDVFFYRALLLLAVTGLLLIFGMVLLQKKLKIDWKDILVTFVATICFHIAFLSTVTVSLDRSLSVWLLCYINDQVETSALTEETLGRAFQEVFIEEYGMLERRLWEQEISGNILKKENEYYITPQGKRMVATFRVVGEVFPVDQKYLYSTN